MTYNDGGTNKTLTQTATYDAWGQMTSSVDASGAQTNFTYNNMGRMISGTNPFPQGGTPGSVTAYAYDLLGRNTLVTLPGGNTVQTSYASSTVLTATDQVNRKIKRETDGLGRLIKVTEQEVSTGAMTQETTYTYDLADRLTGVSQGNQTRAFKYDAEGRLLFERIPEQSATINDGTGTLWTSKYTYTDWGAVATKQDARGVITTYGYDTLHRLTSISYNTVAGVTTASTVTNNYDNVQTSTTKGLLLSTAVGSSYSESYSYDSFKRLSATTKVMDGLTYWTGYQYDTANHLTQITYPNGAVVNIGHDSKGRLSSVGAYLAGVTYNSIGQMTGTTLGNGVSEGYGYEANRMQLTSQTATKSGGPANGLINLTYGYNASPGQMGAASTGGNTGQVVSISGTIGGVNESAAYTYDDLGRLVTSNQTSNGSSAQRRFAYDRWGNRTGMWDATSGGSQIQSSVLQQSSGAPTNRLTSVTNGGVISNYSYDEAGNVMNDGVHSYTYDSENRLVSVDGAATAQYSYDNQNRRYKKVAGGAGTHYIWQGSQVIAEFNSTTRAFIAVNIYAGGQIIARGETSVTKYLLSDRLSTRLVLDGSGNVIGRQGHLPFGEDFAESGTQEKHHFTTYERDSETGADYAVNRLLSPLLGRFTRSDPYSCANNFSTPAKLHRYSYTSNDPINRIDPLGLAEVCKSHEEFVCNRSDLVRGGWDCGWETVTECQDVNPPPPPPQRPCPVQPLQAITDPDAQRFENNPNRVDLVHLTADMQIAVTCFQTAVESRGGTFNIVSAWRPAAYQSHLREVWDKWQLLRNNNTAACSATRQSVQSEMQNHQLVHQPALHSQHTRGIAIDVTISGLPSGTDVNRLGGGCNLQRTVADDPNHWTLH